MNLLFFAPINIYKDASAGAETINQYIKIFAEMGNKICIIACSEGSFRHSNIQYILLKEENSNLKKIRKVYKTIGWVLYPQNKYLYKTTPWLRREVNNILEKLKKSGYTPDAIFLETTSAILMHDYFHKMFPDARLVASLHDFAYQGSKRRAALEQSPFKKLIRNRYLKWAEHNEVNALSMVDVICPHNSGNVAILRNYDALEAKTMLPIVPYYISDYRHKDDDNNHDILFYGLMNRPENYESAIWFIDNVVPSLPSDNRFIVMGGNPIDSLNKRSSEKVVITGFLDEEKVKEYFENSLCMVVPLLFGSGIKTKVLSALKCGLPVLTNAIGIEGIEASPQHDYVHCETPQEYIQAIQTLEKKRGYYIGICESARSFMNERYNAMKSAADLLSILSNKSLNGMTKEKNEINC